MFVHVCQLGPVGWTCVHHVCSWDRWVGHVHNHVVQDRWVGNVSVCMCCVTAVYAAVHNIVLFEAMSCPAMHRLTSSVWLVAKRSH